MVAEDLRIGGYSGCSMNSTASGGSTADPAGGPPGLAGIRVTRRLLSWCAGVALVLAGLVMLGFVAWEQFGTGVVAEHRQTDIREQLRQSWKHPTTTGAAGSQADGPTLGTADALVRIPRFGAGYEVPVIEGVRNQDLSRGIGHFPGTAAGQVGNYALTGYQTTHGGPFKDLSLLRPGDRVIVETANAIYTYRLDTNPNDLIVPLTQSWVTNLVPVPHHGRGPPGMPRLSSAKPTKALITLATSAELFHRNNRMVTFGHLVSTRLK
jgi:sortase A